MRKRILFYSMVMGLVLHTICQASQILTAIKVDTPPVIDGDISDAAWNTALSVSVTDLTVPGQRTHIRLKAVHHDSHLYLLASYNDPDESRAHKPWIWDKQKLRYEMGPEREDRLVIKWAMAPQNKIDLSVYADNEYKTDIWFWKAHRTDPMGFADDKFQILSFMKLPKSNEIQSRSGRKMYLRRKGDAGTAAYKTRLFFEYTKDTLLQYQYQETSGSRGDIRAKGRWQDGVWHVEFKRRFETGHADDVSLKPGIDQLFGVSAYEIAGRKPDPEIQEPYYGCGDIFEHLILRILP